VFISKDIVIHKGCTNPGDTYQQALTKELALCHFYGTGKIEVVRTFQVNLCTDGKWLKLHDDEWQGDNWIAYERCWKWQLKDNTNICLEGLIKSMIGLSLYREFLRGLMWEVFNMVQETTGLTVTFIIS
jgi:hypothetical protein